MVLLISILLLNIVHLSILEPDLNTQPTMLVMVLTKEPSFQTYQRMITTTILAGLKILPTCATPHQPILFLEKL